MKDIQDLICEMRSFGLDVTIDKIKTSTPTKPFINCKVIDGSKSYSGWYSYNGNLCTYSRFDRVEKFTWYSTGYKDAVNKMNFYQRKHFDKKRLKVEEEFNKLEELEREKKFKQLIYKWNIYTPATAETGYDIYFKNKQVKIFKDFKISCTGYTCIPMYTDFNKTIGGFQAIKQQTDVTLQSKKFASGTKMKGCFYPITNGNNISEAGTVFICEGYATGYSLNEIIKKSNYLHKFIVVCCFCAYNLVYVKKYIDDNYSNKNIICCADNDLAGKDYANIACGKNVIVLSKERKGDANDVLIKYGIDEASDIFNDRMELLQIINNRNSNLTKITENS